MNSAPEGQEPRGALVAFYRGEGLDHAGRSLETILGYSDEELERVHDYIQWLFPTRQASAYNSQAPRLDDETAARLRSDVIARGNVKRAFHRMLAFYGLDCDDEDQDDVYVDKGSNFDARKRVWLSANNHNYKRLSRMLASLPELGFRAEARALFRFLARIRLEAGGLIGDAFEHWKKT